MGRPTGPDLRGLPLLRRTCQASFPFIGFLTDLEPITQTLAHIGELTSPLLRHPATGLPQTELDMGRAGGEAEQATHGSFPDDLNRTPESDPTEPDPVAEHDFDQS